jgi:pantoate--beta-alanine ligase
LKGLKIVKTIEEWRGIYSELKGCSIGFVPTMGYLHEGHQSLIKKARKDVEVVVVSIFVNPLQFGKNEDFSTYPRSLERDSLLAEEAGADYLFVPEAEEMYPSPTLAKVTVGHITDMMCGRSRPGHFDGVATVVTKLFNIIRPTLAYFSIKDAQQLAVIQRMVQDLNIPTGIVTCPIVRESDGLAMSSRNVYLTPEERSQAPILNESLKRAKELIEQGERSVQQIVLEIKGKIEKAPLANIDYIEVREYPSLDQKEIVEGQTILALAVKFGKTRLIDNIIVNV